MTEVGFTICVRVVCLSSDFQCFRQRQEELRLLEADMCVKEVEGAQGQESAYRQEGAC